MKRIVLFVLACLCLLDVNAQNQAYERHWEKGVEKIRVMSYNIFNGFNWGEDKDREERFVSWIKEQDPEILAMQELCGFTQEKLSALAARWGHPYAVIVKETGYPVGITSKKPIEVKAKLLEGFGHGLLHVQTYGYDLLVTHLNPSNTIKRNSEAAKIVQYIKEHSLDNCLLMGDMNAHSPMDADYMETNAVRLQSKYGGNTGTNLLDGQFDYSVISHYLSVPLIDVCRLYVSPDKRTTFPTPILMGVSRHKDIRKLTNERIDYILVTPKVAKSVCDAFIYNEGETEYLSDHFPIGIDLLLKNK